MKEPIIEVKHISKRYTIGELQRYSRLTESISVILRNPIKTIRNKIAPKPIIWALKDISFDIHEGEIVGIIGRNGAGKSTLLKIISKITYPTEGEIRLRGRVGSLLEIGSGFHPELTGRENIFFNGAVLGMRKKEIEKKFDDIVKFSEIEKFLDTPVKKYSSGMYVRLAFSVAAHMEQEILLVDEVLAVGDAQFQKKCLGAMKEVSENGRTVIFVSHNMAAITRLCDRTILLENGRILKDGPSYDVIHSYLRSDKGTTAFKEWDEGKSPGDEIAHLHSIRIINENNETIEAADIRKPIGIEMIYDVTEKDKVLIPNYHLYNEDGVCIFIVHDLDPKWRNNPRPLGKYKSIAWIPGNLLAEGAIFVGVALSTMNPIKVHFFEKDIVVFQIIDSLDGNSARGDYAGHMPGIIRPILKWETEYDGK